MDDLDVSIGMFSAAASIELVMIRGLLLCYVGLSFLPLLEIRTLLCALHASRCAHTPGPK